MSYNSLTATSSQSWSRGNQYDGHPQSRNRGNQYAVSQTDEYGRTRPGYFVPVPLYHQPEQGGTSAQWRSFEESVWTGPYGLTGLTNFPSQPHPPSRISVPSPPERVNPRPTQFIRDSPLVIGAEWNLRRALEPDHPGLTDDEFTKAMKLLRKDIYNPTTSNTHMKKKSSWPRGLFGAKSSSNIVNVNITDGKADEEKDRKNYEAKNCTICLEDFVPDEQVLVTPCNHVFHSDCLAPWVRSHGKCPVCRFGFLERIQSSERALSQQSSNYTNTNNDNGRALNDRRRHHHNGRSLNNSHHNNNVVAASEDNNSTVDLVYLIRAMEDAHNWLTVAR